MAEDTVPNAIRMANGLASAAAPGPTGRRRALNFSSILRASLKVQALSLFLAGCVEDLPATAPPAMDRAAALIARSGPAYILSNEDHEWAVTRYVSACWLESLTREMQISHFAAEAFHPIGPVDDPPALIAASSVYVRLPHFDDLVEIAARQGLIFTGYDIGGDVAPATPDGFAPGRLNRREHGAAAGLLGLQPAQGIIFVHTGPGHPDKMWRDTAAGRFGWLGAHLSLQARVISIANSRPTAPAWVTNSAGPCGPSFDTESQALLLDIGADTLSCVDKTQWPGHGPLFDVYAVGHPAAPAGDGYVRDLIPGCALRRAQRLEPPGEVQRAGRYQLTVRQVDALGRLIVSWQGYGADGEPIDAYPFASSPIHAHWTWRDPVSGEIRHTWAGPETDA